MIKTTAQIFACLAYLLNIVGALYVLLFRRKDAFAVYHAKQSLGITLVAIVVFIAWVVIGWLLSWIPYIGLIFAMALFSLVIVAYIVLIRDYIIGLVYVFHAKMQPVPIVGRIIIRLLK